eukprot:6175440-Pleurochrysis_carterae.AAC.1
MLAHAHWDAAVPGVVQLDVEIEFELNVAFAFASTVAFDVAVGAALLVALVVALHWRLNLEVAWDVALAVELGDALHIDVKADAHSPRGAHVPAHPQVALRKPYGRSPHASRTRETSPRSGARCRRLHPPLPTASLFSCPVSSWSMRSMLTVTSSDGVCTYAA